MYLNRQTDKFFSEWAMKLEFHAVQAGNGPLYRLIKGQAERIRRQRETIDFQTTLILWLIAALIITGGAFIVYAWA